MTIPVKVWIKYRDTLAKINRKAFDDMSEFLERIGGYGGHEAEVIDFAYALATKYGEATGALACEMYDAVARASGVNVPPAVPAETATYAETAKAVRGTAKRSETMIPQTVSRLSKQAGADTTLQNAARDRAQFAWIPSGDTCAFCRMLASRGWQNQSKKTLRNGHAEHIHANCDCEYAISFRGGEEYAAFYDPEQYLAEYYEAMDRSESGDWKGALNTMRREHYAQNKDIINAQKRAAYAKRREPKMATLRENDWSRTEARIVSGEEKKEIIRYAEGKGINISDLSLFDGAKELLLEQIDTLSELKQKYPVDARKLTIHPVNFDDKGQLGGLSSNGKTVFVETKALRNREITIMNILADNEFAAREPKDIIIHEYGHILGRKYGTNGIELARKAYYNVFKEEISDEQLLRYLQKNISSHSVSIKKHRNGNISFQELLPEVLVVHENRPSDFTREIMLIMIGGKQ